MIESADPRIIREVTKISPMRRFIGQRMAESLQTIPQATAMIELQTDAVFRLKDQLKAANPNVTITTMFIRFIAVLLREFPLLNSTHTEDTLTSYQSCDIAVGVGMKSGIKTVVIREAQSKDVFSISDELREKTDRLKAGKLPLEDMKYSTFTISSVGMMNVKYATVVINPPEAAVFGLGTTERRLIVLDDDSTEIQRITSASLTIDHAIIDGYHAGEAIQLLERMVQNPEAYMERN